MKYYKQEEIQEKDDEMMHTFKSMREAYDQEPKIIACPHCRKEFEIR